MNFSIHLLVESSWIVWYYFLLYILLMFLLCLCLYRTHQITVPLRCPVVAADLTVTRFETLSSKSGTKYNTTPKWNVYMLIKAGLRNDPWEKDLDTCLLRDQKEQRRANINFISYNASNASEQFENTSSVRFAKKLLYQHVGFHTSRVCRRPARSWICESCTRDPPRTGECASQAVTAADYQATGWRQGQGGVRDSQCY